MCIIFIIVLSLVALWFLTDAMILRKRIRQIDILNKLDDLKRDFKEIVGGQDVVKLDINEISFLAVVGDEQKFVIELGVANFTSSLSITSDFIAFKMYVQNMLKKNGWTQKIEIKY